MSAGNLFDGGRILYTLPDSSSATAGQVLSWNGSGLEFASDSTGSVVGTANQITVTTSGSTDTISISNPCSIPTLQVGLNTTSTRLGTSAGLAFTSSTSSDVAIGCNALEKAVLGSPNSVAVGYAAMQNSETAEANVCIGSAAGRNLGQGVFAANNNTIIGSSAASSVNELTNCIVIGQGATLTDTSANVSVFGNSSMTLHTFNGSKPIELDTTTGTVDANNVAAGLGAAGSITQMNDAGTSAEWFLSTTVSVPCIVMVGADLQTPVTISFTRLAGKMVQLKIPAFTVTVGGIADYEITFAASSTPVPTWARPAVDIIIGNLAVKALATATLGSCGSIGMANADGKLTITPTSEFWETGTLGTTASTQITYCTL